MPPRTGRPIPPSGSAGLNRSPLANAFRLLLAPLLAARTWLRAHRAFRTRLRTWIAATLLLLAAAPHAPEDVTRPERGRVWCNDPLPATAARPFDALHLEVARRGYLYALAGALALQGDDIESRRHRFHPPARLVQVDQPARSWSGFEATTFTLFDAPGDARPAEVIIAFAGTNDLADWLLTNVGFSDRQHREARAYTARVAARYPGVPLVVTGYSLGGALAAHVTKHAATRALVQRAWLFNPSPKLHANDRLDRRIWMAAVRDEALAVARDPAFRWLPGVNRIGAPVDQRAEDFYLVNARPIRGHFRWTLARNMLFAADHAHRVAPGPVDTRRTSEPLEILQASHFVACARPSVRRG